MTTRRVFLKGPWCKETGLLAPSDDPRNPALGDMLNATDYFEEIRMRETGYRVTLSVGFNPRSNK